VHRDFKPDNVIVGDDDRVRVLDFGLARPAEVEDIERSYMLPPSDAGVKELDTPLTLTGAVLGTPAYMSPEQHQGKQADERSDQFSFCVALYEGLFGERPYAGETRPELVTSVLAGKVRDAPRRTNVPTFLRKVVLRGLSTKPAERHASVQELLRELQKDPARTKRQAIAAAVVAAVVGFGGWGIYSAQQANALQCTGAEDKLAGIWDDERKQQVRGALLATELPYAEAAWAGVEKALDGYTQSWVEMNTEACEATNIRGEQSTEMLHLKMACLERRLVDVRTLVDMLAEADARVTENAVQAAGSLKPLDRCNDADALSSEVRPPEDPKLAAKVAEQRERLARAKSLQDAGKYAEGLALARKAVEEARVLEYPPVLAEALLRLGDAQKWQGEEESAEKNLEEAYWAALGAKHDQVLAEAATLLISVVGDREGRREDALQWVRHAEAAVRRVGLGGVEEARMLQRHGALAIDIEPEKARKDLERALAIFERTLGPDHPEVAMTLKELGNVGENLESKIAYYRRALDIWERTLGPDHPLQAMSLNNLGLDLARQGKHEEARLHLERALEVWESALGPEHPFVDVALGNLGAQLLWQNEYDEARPYLERSLALREKEHGREHWEVANALTLLGYTWLGKGDLRQAQEHFARALPMAEKTHGSEHPDVAHALAGLGLTFLAKREPTQAVALLERALLIYEKEDPDDSTAGNLPSARFSLARALWETGKDRRRAVELATQAQDGYGIGFRIQRAEVEAWLAKHGGEK
jgi:tetratricopeptide (TPR) repeat protein